MLKITASSNIKPESKGFSSPVYDTIKSGIKRILSRASSVNRAKRQ